jgi:hypothetical protein
MFISLNENQINDTIGNIFSNYKIEFDENKKLKIVDKLYMNSLEKITKDFSKFNDEQIPFINEINEMITKL